MKGKHVCATPVRHMQSLVYRNLRSHMSDWPVPDVRISFFSRLGASCHFPDKTPSTHTNAVARIPMPVLPITYSDMDAGPHCGAEGSGVFDAAFSNLIR